jgi:hypothetical protein
MKIIQTLKRIDVGSVHELTDERMHTVQQAKHIVVMVFVMQLNHVEHVRRIVVYVRHHCVNCMQLPRLNNQHKHYKQHVTKQRQKSGQINQTQRQLEGGHVLVMMKWRLCFAKHQKRYERVGIIE